MTASTLSVVEKLPSEDIWEVRTNSAAEKASALVVENLFFSATAT